ncbi:MAG: phosphonate C-P lyase system protein PhnL [Alphaproteobacteria bacterium]|jgi:alpha-D-ribose 1-methylphosphonate 5-triphosphate synthase subunit PhnL|nr:phosphonate C-P lyase system protein PhnL [Rhodospirillaceae bacterium]MBT6205258.1 phosphonate C-P lyase system protein PhnL [Rhodospirillaceae bacterium]MBT6511103.1 phosphonate C-P lyase system protein PhnL [Rhodospirillaceae bacterium]MBT7645467.1 phosphonate C-P lyase system protein PhnL [Rhodospirillaceae bacterium]MDG2480198.1 phosphonate C-P lyase system protein PhnL [Alphaproteobacteria bacterium]
MTQMIRLEDLAKTFVLHLQGRTELPVFENLDLTVEQGECLALTGPSGAGKSTLLRSLCGNYLPDRGRALIRHDGEMLDLVAAPPRAILTARRLTLGYVSQFLRVIPRIPTVDIVAEPAVTLGMERDAARTKAAALLSRLNIGAELHALAPATFSGGEQQRVNVARGFIVNYPILLLDEPTASLDAANRDVVVDLILEARERGAAIVGIFHDEAVRKRVADRTFDLLPQQAAA